MKYEPSILCLNPEKVVSLCPRSFMTEDTQFCGVIMFGSYFLIFIIAVLTPAGLTEIMSILSLFYLYKVREYMSRACFILEYAPTL